MPTPTPNDSPSDSDLIGAARAGDRRAAAELVERYLPFAYTVVRRALDDSADADDVVQETMLRAVADLPRLRSPDSFRAWLAAIAVHQVGTHQRRRRRTDERTAGLAAADEVAVPSFEDAAIQEADRSRQRYQVTEAARWLDPGDRTLLSLWWLEVAGQLSRAELASAAGVSLAHAGVRVQRMRGQLEVARSVVAALSARPRCPQLAGLAADWDGRHDALWRKRFARHVRGCPVCADRNRDATPPESLLTGYALLPVPLALGAGLLGKGLAGGAVVVGGGAKAGLLGHLAQLVSAHPVAAVFAAGTVVAGATVTAVSWPAAPVTRPPAVVTQPSPSAPRPSILPASRGPAAPSASPRPVTSGRLSFDVEATPGAYLTITTGDVAVLAPLPSGGPAAARQLATFEAVVGLNDPACYSFRSADGRYLRHSMWRLRLSKDEGTPLFRGDATFCVRPAAGTAGSVLLESSNYPGWFVHRRGSEVWVDHSDGSAAFLAACAFRPRPPLAG